MKPDEMITYQWKTTRKEVLKKLEVSKTVKYHLICKLLPIRSFGDSFYNSKQSYTGNVSAFTKELFFNFKNMFNFGSTWNF